MGQPRGLPLHPQEYQASLGLPTGSLRLQCCVCFGSHFWLHPHSLHPPASFPDPHPGHSVPPAFHCPGSPAWESLAGECWGPSLPQHSCGLPGPPCLLHQPPASPGLPNLPCHNWGLQQRPEHPGLHPTWFCTPPLPLPRPHTPGLFLFRLLKVPTPLQDQLLPPLRPASSPPGQCLPAPTSWSHGLGWPATSPLPWTTMLNSSTWRLLDWPACLQQPLQEIQLQDAGRPKTPTHLPGHMTAPGRCQTSPPSPDLTQPDRTWWPNRPSSPSVNATRPRLPLATSTFAAWSATLWSWPWQPPTGLLWRPPRPTSAPLP
jgi:hypothetical protein